jgi:hypothetical protein
MDGIQDQQFMLLTGAQASGKMTWLFSLNNQLAAKGYQVL